MCLNFSKTSIFTSSVALKIYSTNNKFNCKSICFICLLNYKQCSKQYVGQTLADFPFRFQICDINDLFLECFFILQNSISLSGLFLTTCFLCILQTQLTRRNTSLPQKFNKHQHMNFVTMSSKDSKSHIYWFFIETFSLLSIQYMFELSCKTDKCFWDTACFFSAGLQESSHNPSMLQDF